jgi:hypothetical protein
MQLTSPDLTSPDALKTSPTDFVAVPIDLIKGADGSKLLDSVPLDGQGKSVQMKWDSTQYIIRANTTQGDDSCWYVSDKSSNISDKISTLKCISASIQLGK